MYQNNHNEEWTFVPYGKRNGYAQQSQSQSQSQLQSQYQKSWKYTRNNNEIRSLSGSQTENENYKKILCKNINNVGKCIYNNKCLYAHSLEEQNVDSIRILAYDMIKKDDDLSHIDLSKNKHLYNNLLSLTKECQQCLDRKCTGGYNCKHGVCDKNYVICQIDLNKGTCEGGCKKIHLTEKGLIPYGVIIMRNLKIKPEIPKPVIINDDFFKFLEKNTNGIKKHENDVYRDNDSECSDTYSEMLSHQMEDDTFYDLNFDCNFNKEEKTKQSIFKALNH